MLNFRNTNMVFALLLFFCIGYNIRHPFPFYLYLVLLFLYSLLLFYGSYFIQAKFYIRSVCSADTDKKEIALSFDDGPAPEYTPDMLRILKEYNVEAAFFCIGNRIAGNETLLQSVLGQGHIIGNHSYSHHFWFDLFSSRKMLADMQAMNASVQKITGLSPRLFRPPYGVTNPNLRKAVTRGNYISIGWNIRSLDTVIRDEKKLLEKIIRAIRPGSIILLHDTSKTTLAILPALIKKIRDDGYSITRLDKMLNLNPYA